MVYKSKSYAFFVCGRADVICTLFYIEEKYILPTMSGGYNKFSPYIYCFLMSAASARPHF